MSPDTGPRLHGEDENRALPYFVYGTLRPGGRNHEAWLGGRLDWTRPARLGHHRLHHHRHLPYVTPGGDGAVIGELVHATADRAAALLADIDVLEGVAVGHYVRVTTSVTTAADVAPVTAWVYLAGPLVAADLDGATEVAGGDWAPWLATG